ncbi:MAG: hypothetical protein DRH11_03415 [Deltaproteobacteria bacterium]|nr:MAG: hypothetical protein DRH11_03415 [Deltaproteobacteria bacterium]
MYIFQASSFPSDPPPTPPDLNPFFFPHLEISYALDDNGFISRSSFGYLNDMILSASQPYFAPFPGYFFKAHLSDVFVILDEVQFPRGTTWISRNRFKNDQGTLWMTIPVWKKGLGLQRINEVRIYYEGRWPKKHLGSLKSAYARAPYFHQHLGFLQELFSQQVERLIDFNMRVIKYLLEHLQIQTKIVMLSELQINETGNKRLIKICKRLGASQFLAQASAKKYLDLRMFQQEGITIEFFKPPSPVYPQLWGNFLPNLSAFDLLFNCGPKSHDILITG